MVYRTAHVILGAVTISLLSGIGASFFVDKPLREKLSSAGTKPEKYTIHDPSRVITWNGKQMIAATGRVQKDGYDCGLETWHRAAAFERWQPGQCLFREKPEWIERNIPTHSGAFWAPELVNSTAMYYSVASWNESSPVTCVGLATATGQFPDRMQWIDSGAPVVCVNNKDWDREVSAIDPTFLRTWTGGTFLITGGGIIHGIEVNAKTLLPKRRSWFAPGVADWKLLAKRPVDGEKNWVEASYVQQYGGWFYLFVNWGQCCLGVESTYEIRMGRAKTPLGPYKDKSGVDMLEGGGTLVLDSKEFMLGPGQVGIWKHKTGEHVLSFHYYDKRRDGAPWVAERILKWKNGWPEVDQLKSSFPSSAVLTAGNQ